METMERQGDPHLAPTFASDLPAISGGDADAGESQAQVNSGILLRGRPQ
jgi:hypothetical protein